MIAVVILIVLVTVLSVYSAFGTYQNQQDIKALTDMTNGKWITIWREDDPDTSTHARCSVCNRMSERPLGEYCKWCGAKMSQE